MRIRPVLVGKHQGRDWKYQSRWKMSNLDWKFQAWIEIFKRVDWKIFAINCWPVLTRPFSFLTFCWRPLFSRRLSVLFSSTSALLCRGRPWKGHSTELGEGQLQDGPLHEVREGIPSRNLRKKGQGLNFSIRAFWVVALQTAPTKKKTPRNPPPLANGGLARKALIRPKRALSGQFLLFPRGCEVWRNWSWSAPKRPLIGEFGRPAEKGWRGGSGGGAKLQKLQQPRKSPKKNFESYDETYDNFCVASPPLPRGPRQKLLKITEITNLQNHEKGELQPQPRLGGGLEAIALQSLKWCLGYGLTRPEILPEVFKAYSQSLRNTPSTAGNSMTSSGRLSPEPLLKKEAPPAVLGGEIILQMLWKPQMPWIIGLGGSQPYSRREFQETLWERFRGLSGVFPEFLPESASRTGAMIVRAENILIKFQGGC